MVKCFAIFLSKCTKLRLVSFLGAQGSLRFAERPSVGNSDVEASTKMLIPTSILILLVSTLNFERKTSDIIKWSFWRRSAKRLIPVESTCLTVYIPPLGTSGGSKSLLLYRKCTFLLLSSGTPHFWSSASIVLRPPIFESEIAAFSFRVLRTKSILLFATFEF